MAFGEEERRRSSGMSESSLCNPDHLLRTAHGLTPSVPLHYMDGKSDTLVLSSLTTAP